MPQQWRPLRNENLLGAGDLVSAQLEALLQQEESSLVDLERLVAQEHALLFGPDPRDLLARLQEIEEGLSRVRQLDAGRKRLVAATGKGASDTGSGGGASGSNQSVFPMVWTFRKRVLGLIAGIAWQNEANSQLIAGLTRVADRKLAWLVQSEGASAPDISDALNKSATERRQARLEVQA